MAGIVALGTFTALTTAMTVIFTWLCNNSQASLLLAILLHGSINYFQVVADRSILSADTASTITGIGMVLACIVLAVLLLAVTRGRLSYGRYQREAKVLDLAPTMEHHVALGARQ